MYLSRYLLINHKVGHRSSDLRDDKDSISVGS